MSDIDEGDRDGDNAYSGTDPHYDGPYEYEIKLKIPLTAEKLVAAFGDTAPDDVRTLVMELDAEVGLWALTVLLYRHFQRHFNIILEKNPELAAKPDEELLAMLEDE